MKTKINVNTICPYNDFPGMPCVGTDCIHCETETNGFNFCNFENDVLAKAIVDAFNMSGNIACPFMHIEDVNGNIDKYFCSTSCPHSEVISQEIYELGYETDDEYSAKGPMIVSCNYIADQVRKGNGSK